MKLNILPNNVPLVGNYVWDIMECKRFIKYFTTICVGCCLNNPGPIKSIEFPVRRITQLRQENFLVFRGGDITFTTSSFLYLLHSMSGAAAQYNITLNTIETFTTRVAINGFVHLRLLPVDICLQLLEFITVFLFSQIMVTAGDTT